MDDDIVAMVQGDWLRRLLHQAELVTLDVWSRYVADGGTVAGYEVDADLHGALVLPAGERDALARAANQLTTHLDLVPAPYSYQLRGPIRLAHRIRRR